MRIPRFFQTQSQEEDAERFRNLPVRHCEAGEIILREGAPNKLIYCVDQGEFSVWKGPVNQPRGVELTVLQEGDYFGEMSVLNDRVASATLVANRSSTLREVDLEKLPISNGKRADIVHNLARTLVQRLDDTNRGLHEKHEAEQNAYQRLIASLMMVGRILIILSLYVFLLPIADWLKPILPSDSLVSFGFIIMLTAMTWNYQRTSGLPKAEFGLNFKNWPQQILIGLKRSVPWILFFVVLKFILISQSPANDQLIEPWRAMNSENEVAWDMWFLFALIYSGMSFAQEYVRVVVQGALNLFYRTAGQPDRWKSLLIANIVFSVLHVHLSPIFAVMAFFTGLIWGWIFQCEKSYLATAVAHAAMGLFGVFILGVPY